jgi:alkylation response protein AidB-like acyl-CoA dehydrogenase
MDFSLTGEQQAVVDLAAGLFRDHGDDARIRRITESGDVFDAALWQLLAETGLLGLAVPEEAGGSGLGMLETALVLEQQGRWLGAVPLWRHQVATLAIARFAGDALRDALLPGLRDGTRIASVWSEAGPGGAVAARRLGDGWALSGTADAVVLGPRVAVLLLPVQEGLAVVPMDAAGLTRIEGVATNHEPVATLRFDAVAIPAGAMLTPPAGWLEARICLAVAAMQLGVTAEALRRAAAYASERQQFGRAIGSFQGVALRMADAYIEVELLRGGVWNLAWRLDQGLPALAAARVAKWQAAQAGHIVGHTAQHYHGGVGADLTYPVHRFFLWARALELTGGGAEVQLARLAADELPDIAAEEAA